MKILVAGGTGYLGSKLIDQLLKSTNDIAALYRKCIVKKEYKLQWIDLTNPDFEQAFLAFKPDICICLTCQYENSNNSMQTVLNANYVFPSLLLEFAIKCNCSRFISVGTSLPRFLNTYALAKKQFNEFGLLCANNFKIEFISVLLESFYGSDEPTNRFLSRSIQLLMTNQNLNLTEGTQKRDWVDVNDVVNIIIFLIDANIAKVVESKSCLYCEIPVGSGEAPRIRDVIQYLRDLTNSSSKLIFGAVPMRQNEPNTVADLTKLRKLGYKDEILNWKNGMKKMLLEMI